MKKHGKWDVVNSMLRQFNFLWSIRHSWGGVTISVKRASNDHNEFQRELARGAMWVYSEAEQIGRKMEDLLEEGDSQDEEKFFSTLLRLSAVSHWIKFVIVVPDPMHILILKAPSLGWERLFSTLAAELEPVAGHV